MIWNFYIVFLSLTRSNRTPHKFGNFFSFFRGDTCDPRTFYGRCSYITQKDHSTYDQFSQNTIPSHPVIMSSSSKDRWAQT